MNARWTRILLLGLLAILQVPALANDDLASAVASGNAALVRAALDAGADVNANLGDGRTPLITAVIASRPQAVAVLLERGADPNRTADDPTMGNALSAAFMAMNGVALLGRLDEPDPERQARALEVLRLVASKRPNCDVLVRRATSQFSPLMLAAEAGALEAVKILLAAGANPNLQNQGKYSALDFAVDRPPVWSQSSQAARAEIVRLLLAAGAKTEKKGADGVSPLERARRAGNAAAVEQLSRAH